MTMQDNGLTRAQQQAIEHLYGAFNERNPDLLDQALADDWEDIPLGPHQQPGLAGMKPVIGLFTTAFPDVKITILDIFGRDGRAAVRAQSPARIGASSSVSHRAVNRSPSPSTSSTSCRTIVLAARGIWKIGSGC